MEGPSANNCRRNGVNPAISVKGTTPVFPLNAKKCEFAKLCPADSQLKFNSA